MNAKKYNSITTVNSAIGYLHKEKPNWACLTINHKGIGHDITIHLFVGCDNRRSIKRGYFIACPPYGSDNWWLGSYKFNRDYKPTEINELLNIIGKCQVTSIHQSQKDHNEYKATIKANPIVWDSIMDICAQNKKY